MKANELIRLLKSHGGKVEDGTRHWKVTLGNLSTRVPRHPAQEIKTGTLNAILRDLGLKEKSK